MMVNMNLNDCARAELYHAIARIGSCMCELEGMTAENRRCAFIGNAPYYEKQRFDDVKEKLDKIASDLSDLIEENCSPF